MTEQQPTPPVSYQELLEELQRVAPLLVENAALRIINRKLQAATEESVTEG